MKTFVAVILLISLDRSSTLSNNIQPDNPKGLDKNDYEILMNTGRKIVDKIEKLQEDRIQTENKLNALIEKGIERENTLKTLIENGIESLKTYVAKYEEENKSLKNNISQLLTIQANSQGLTFANGQWFLGSKAGMNFAEAIRWCSDRNAEMFVPRTKEETAYMLNFIKTTKAMNIWFPITDAETEGKFFWTNGTEFTKEDELQFKWFNSDMVHTNYEKADCGGMLPGGLYIAGCHWVHPSVLCKPKYRIY